MDKQLNSMKEDQNEFKNITKRYTDQLVKVKVDLNYYCAHYAIFDGDLYRWQTWQMLILRNMLRR
jgi:hypothetical protein